MDKYKVLTPREEYYVEAESKNKARKEVMAREDILINKTEEFDDDIYYQKNKRYEGKKIGETNTSMQNYGCALMCFSYVKNLDPLDVNEKFIKEGVYGGENGDEIIFQKACDVLDLNNYERNYDVNRMPTQEETIKEVKLGRGKHFVVRFNRNGQRDIFDPWTGDFLPINYYPFTSYRIFDKN